jgi:hypothetical protein
MSSDEPDLLATCDSWLEASRSIFSKSKSIPMYANTEHPPAAAVQIAQPRLDAAEHLSRVSHISRLLALITSARERLSYASLQYDSYSLHSSPFVSRERWLDDVRRWSYICYRLESYYLKKVCALNSAAYRSLIENG